MRIVGPNRQGVQSLGRHSVGNTGLEGEAKLAGTIGDVAQSLGNQIAGLISHRETQKASTNISNAQHAFDEQFQGQEFFDVADLPGEIVTPEMAADPQGRVAAALVRPALYEYHMKDVIKNSSEGIGLPSVRADWEARVNEQFGLNYSKLAVQSTQEIQRQFEAEQKADYQSAIQAGNWGLAESLADGMYATEAEKEQLKLDARQGMEGEVYTNAMAAKNLEAIEESIEFLEKEEEDYTGILNEDQRLSYLRSLYSARNNIVEDGKADLTLAKERLNYRIATEQDNASKGRMSSADTLNELYRDTVEMNIATNGAYERELLEIEDTMAIARLNNEMIGLSRDERTAFSFIAPARAFEKEYMSEMRANKAALQLRASNEALTLKENEDAMQAWADAGSFGPNGLVPINFADTDSLISRNIQYQRATQRYGFPGQGMLTKAEAERFSQQWNEMKPIEQMAYMQLVDEALEQDALFLYQQLATDGSAGALSIAGAAMNLSDNKEVGQYNAEMILKGREFMRHNPDIMKETKIIPDLQLFIAETLGNFAYDDYEYRQAVNDAIMSAYIGMRMPSGDFTFDQKVFDQAVEMGTGGTFEHGGSVIDTPGYGMPKGTMEEWIKKTDWTYLEETSGAIRDYGGMEVGTKSFWEDFQDGKITLRSGPGPDVYTFVWPDGTSVKNNNQNYTIKYDPAAITSSERERQEREEDQKEGGVNRRGGRGRGRG